jgi:formate hydrogenlyase subunit 6/NADH:ubiquinone oxidoreductase subunit I
MAKVMERIGDSFAERVYLPAIIDGLKVTTRHFVRNLFGRKDTVTIAYPDVKIPYAPRWRGQHRLLQREDGEPRCVACFMCSTACPAKCILRKGRSTASTGSRRNRRSPEPISRARSRACSKH